MFDVRHQAVDETDVLDVLPGDDLVVEVVAQAIGVFFQEEAPALGDLLLGEDLQHADGLLLGVEGQAVHQDHVALDGPHPGVPDAVGLVVEADALRGRGLVRVDALDGVAHQAQNTFPGHQVEAGVQVEEFLDDRH